MGVFSQMRFAQKIQKRQMMGYSLNHGKYQHYQQQNFYHKKKKTEIEKFVDSQKISYPCQWQYFVNRISSGINELSFKVNEGKVNLTDDQVTLLHDFVKKYWSNKYQRLVIKGHKNMDYFAELNKLVPDFQLLKALYGGKNDWAIMDTEVALKSPVSGSHWINDGFIEIYRAPLLLTYNFEHSKHLSKATLITPQAEIGKDKFQLEKVLVKPIGIDKANAWKYSHSYWAWLPALQKEKVFVEQRITGNVVRKNYQFWSDVKK